MVNIDKKSLMIVIVAALGYFVDIYDLILFGIVRVPSLQELGLDAEQMKKQGAMLLSLQMTGMLLGGILFGILGDTKGRVKVLFGSILLYSLANLANGFVHDITTYAIVRFIAGVGLAGELGAGITLISETMSRENRGYGTMIVVVFGALGAVLAAFVGEMNWRTAYFVGGGLGLLLLALRVGTYESGMFNDLEERKVKKGAFLSLFTHRKRFFKYLSCILIGLPVWYVVGILIVFTPEFSKVFQLTGLKASKAIMYTYIGLSFGDLMSGIFSQVFRNRRKVVLVFIGASLVFSLVYLYGGIHTPAMFYWLCFLLGTSTGFWALFVTIASEQFGTNIRATVTTTVPNFVRGAVAPITSIFLVLSDQLGIIQSAAIIGVVCTILAAAATLSVEETFGKDLDYTEPV